VSIYVSIYLSISRVIPKQSPLVNLRSKLRIDPSSTGFASFDQGFSSGELVDRDRTMCVCVCVCVYPFGVGGAGPAGEQKRKFIHMCKHLYTHTHTHIYIHMYMYTCRHIGLTTFEFWVKGSGKPLD